jgi:hypothetical protein
MNIRRLLIEAIQSLNSNKLRTALTMLGIVMEPRRQFQVPSNPWELI